MLRKWLGKLSQVHPASNATDGVSRAQAERLVEAARDAENSGLLKEACELYRQAIVLAPQHAPAHLNLGAALEASGDVDGALNCFATVLEADRQSVPANYNIGRLHFLQGASARAEPCLRAAIRGRPDFAEAQTVLAALLEQRGDLLEAAGLYRAALKQRPGDFGGWLGYGLLLRKLGRATEAEAALARASALDASNAEVHAALFDIVQARGDSAAALQHLEIVLRHQPDRVDALFNRGTLLMGMERLDEADAAFERVIDLDGAFAPAYRMRASVLHRLGRIEEMVALCRAGRVRNPQRFEIESFELLGLNFLDDVSCEELFARHRDFGQRLEHAVPKRFHQYRNRPDPERRLRIGYVSGDFSYHPVSLFLLPLIERLDKSKFETYGYHTSARSDALTRTLQGRLDRWREASRMSDDELADAIHRDEIDILLDLSGHTGSSKLAMFARQPAPVQATWLGYPNTTGLTRIGYRITDSFNDPPGVAEQWNTEKLVRLPHGLCCYRPFVLEAGSRKAPVETRGYVTFGVSTQIAKITPSMRAAWRQILDEVPDSRLAIAGMTTERVRAELIATLAREGIDPAKVELLPFMPVREYLRSFDNVDMVLDTSPYSGGTTTCDALWMGVPVVTWARVRPGSRMAAGVLAAAGLTDWIAATREDYVRRAVAFALERTAIIELRRSLRARMSESPLMQESRLALDMENAYRAMWSDWCSKT